MEPRADNMGSVTARMYERTYRVVGSEGATLRRAIALLGPSVGAHKGCAACTHWVLRWSYRAERTGGLTRATDPHVECEVVVTLPRWDPPRTAAPALVALWQDVLAELRAHEDGHVALGIAAAEDVRTTLVTVTARGGARELHEVVAPAVTAVMDARRSEERAYDASALATTWRSPESGSALARLGVYP